MIRTALLAGAGVIAVGCVACTPKPQPPPPSVWSTEHRGHICNPDDPDSFVASVHFVEPGYDPADYQKTKFAPPPVTDRPLPDAVKADLRSAFLVAPSFFRRDVCALDGVFINPDTCDTRGLSPSCFDASWGFRSPNEPNRGYRYIAISLSNWPLARSPRRADSGYGGHEPDRRPARKLTEYSTIQLNTVLKTLNPLTLKASPKFDSSDDSANSSGMTVLTVLAHELGHVRWYDWLEPVPSLVHDRVDLELLRKCTPDGSLFFQGSWSPLISPDMAFVTPYWIAFGDRADPKLVSHEKDGPQFSDFTHPGQRRTDGSQPNLDTYRPPRGGDQRAAALAASLDDLYGDNRPWASLLGFVSPTEDLVETYVLSVLTQASPPLRSLRLTIPSPNRAPFHEDIVANLSDRPALERKVRCVSTLSDAY
jgi:hypothetical protein